MKFLPFCDSRRRRLAPANPYLPGQAEAPAIQRLNECVWLLNDGTVAGDVKSEEDADAFNGCRRAYRPDVPKADGHQDEHPEQSRPA